MDELSTLCARVGETKLREMVAAVFTGSADVSSALGERPCRLGAECLWEAGRWFVHQGAGVRAG